MSAHREFDDEQEPEPEESFGRPFLGQQIKAEKARSATDEVVEDSLAGSNRPYLMTGGRTGGGASGIGIETVLVRDHSSHPARYWSAETRMIVAACETPVAVAEVAARVGLPIGVVQVLAGDLVSDGTLLRSGSSMALADDVLFIERLIHGVTAL